MAISPCLRAESRGPAQSDHLSLWCKMRRLLRDNALAEAPERAVLASAQWAARLPHPHRAPTLWLAPHHICNRNFQRKQSDHPTTAGAKTPGRRFPSRRISLSNSSGLEPAGEWVRRAWKVSGHRQQATDRRHGTELSGWLAGTRLVSPSSFGPEAFRHLRPSGRIGGRPTYSTLRHSQRDLQLHSDPHRECRISRKVCASRSSVPAEADSAKIRLDACQVSIWPVLHCGLR